MSPARTCARTRTCAHVAEGKLLYVPVTTYVQYSTLYSKFSKHRQCQKNRLDQSDIAATCGAQDCVVPARRHTGPPHSHPPLPTPPPLDPFRRAPLAERVLASLAGAVSEPQKFAGGAARAPPARRRRQWRMAFPARGVVVAGRCRCRRSRGDGGSGAFAVLALAATLIMTAPPAWRAPSSRGRSLIVAEAAGEGAVRSAVSAFIHRGDEAHDGAVATPPKFLFSNEGGAAPAALWSTWLAGLSNRTDRPKAAALVAKLTYHPPDHAMRRARSLVGDTQRLHAFIRKLRAGRCVRVLNLGACACL